MNVFQIIRKTQGNDRAKKKKKKRKRKVYRLITVVQTEHENMQTLVIVNSPFNLALIIIIIIIIAAVKARRIYTSQFITSLIKHVNHAKKIETFIDLERIDDWSYLPIKKK